MKAAVLYERRKPLDIEDVDLVEPGPGEVEIELVASGVCHSDLHHVQRDTATIPCSGSTQVRLPPAPRAK